MRELANEEIDLVSGAMNDWTAGGIAVIGIGLSGGPATGIFGLAVGGAMMVVGYYADE